MQDIVYLECKKIKFPNGKKGLVQSVIDTLFDGISLDEAWRSESVRSRLGSPKAEHASYACCEDSRITSFPQLAVATGLGHPDRQALWVRQHAAIRPGGTHMSTSSFLDFGVRVRSGRDRRRREFRKDRVNG